MKKILKAVTALFLCAVITGSLCTVSFAQGEDNTAFVVVSGMNTFPLYDSENNKVYPLSTSSIASLAAKLLPEIMKYLVTKDGECLCNSILPVLKQAFEPIACSSDGSSKYNLHTDIFDGYLGDKAEYFLGKDKDEEGIVHAGIEKFGEDRTFFFNYDWRLDPLEHADRLHSFINTVKELTGCDRVSLAAFSMGGTVLLSYLQKYGSADIDTAQFCSTAFQGTATVGELFKGELNISLEGLIDRLGQLTRDDGLYTLIDYINEGLTKNGFNARVSDFANELLTSQKSRIYSELLTPIFGYMPGLWALADYDDFNADKLFMLSDNDNNVLSSRIDFYHSNVQGKASELLFSAEKDTDLYIISQYNMRGLCVSEGSTNESNDFLIECKYSSGGATVAPLGSTLGENYKQAFHPEADYLSADGIIDASTCIMPDKTWFVKNMAHIDFPYGGDGAAMIIYFASLTQQQTVFTAEYSQFNRYDYKTEKLSPVTAKESSSVLAEIAAFFSKIRNMFYELAARISDIFTLSRK